MDTIRLFLGSNNNRNSKRKKHLINNKNSEEIQTSNNNILITNDDEEKLSKENIKSFLSTQSPSISALSYLPLLHHELETWSGVSIPLTINTDNTIVAASASQSVSNAQSFTINHASKRRRSFTINHKRRHPRHSLVLDQHIHQTSTFRRTKSHRYPDRTRKHSLKTRYGSEKLPRNRIQPFQSTYRQRNEEFHKVFKELPTTERLLVDYSCALQKDILTQGRMYLSQNYVCFYANILNWKTNLCLKFQDIVNITREKTAKVISNAIEIKTNKAEKYFFASFVTREKTYNLIYQLWKDVIDEKPISNEQLWKMIHENYGDDLDMTTDEEDTCHKTSFDLSKQPIQSNDKYDRITLDTIESKTIQQDDDYSSISSRGEHQTDDENINSINNDIIKNPSIEQSQSSLIKQDINKISNNTEINYLKQCSCESHLATEIINRTYSMSVEQLFDYIFGDNDFLVAYRKSRRIKDYHASEWKMNNETRKRERLCTYKVTVSAVFGSTTICSSERQIIENESSKSHYIIYTEVRNEGIKYADSFFVASRYCLVQIGPNKSHFKLTCEVRYIKSVMAIIKAFIEKNAMAALQDSFTDLMKRMDHESSKRTRAQSACKTTNEQEQLDQSQLVTNSRLSQQEQITELTSSTNDLSINSQQEESTQDDISADVVLQESFFSSKNNFLTLFCLISVLFLLIVNIFLCVKLNHIDQMTDRLVQNYPTSFNRFLYQQDDNEWSSLLKKQEEYYQTQLTSLHSVLITTHNALKNVTNALYQLSQLSSGSS